MAASTTTFESGASTAAPTETEDDFYGEDEEYDDEEGVITEIGGRKQKRIVLTKRTYLLFAFVLVTILSIAATVYTFVFHLEEYDYPPTDYSHGSLRDTLYALIALTVVTPIGFVILKFRITNLVIGVLYLFLLVLCLVFPAKGIAFAVYCLAEDTEYNIHVFAKNPLKEHKLHNFWAAFQEKYSCCGTKEIDRVEDWSYFLNSTDLPASCCTKKQKSYARSLGLLLDGNDDFVSPLAKHRKPELDKSSSYCGLGLARTRTRGLGLGGGPNAKNIFKRIYSGFFLSLTEKQKDAIKIKFVNPRFDDRPHDVNVKMMDAAVNKIRIMDAKEAFRKIWKNFYADNVCNRLIDLDKMAKIIPGLPKLEGKNNKKKYCALYDPDTPNDIAYPSDLDVNNLPESIGIYRTEDHKATYDTCITQSWPIYNSTIKTNATRNFTSAHDYCKDQLPKLRESPTTMGRELLLQLDYLTSYIYELGKPKEHSNVVIQKGTWILWPIPLHFNMSTDLYPFKLVANLFRVPTKEQTKDSKGLKKMYYFSRGIAENLVLQDVIHEKPCEFLDPSNLPGVESKIARDMNKRWRKEKDYVEWKNKELGLGKFFLVQVHKIVLITLGVSTSCIFCVIILAVVFWQYYSRIKAEEYANLALPKEFEVLHLRRGSLIDEEDIARDVKRAKRLLAAKRRVAPAAPVPVPATTPRLQRRPGQRPLPPGAAPSPFPGPHQPPQGPHQLPQGPHQPPQGPHQPLQGPHQQPQGPHQPFPGAPPHPSHMQQQWPHPQHPQGQLPHHMHQEQQGLQPHHHHPGLAPPGMGQPTPAGAPPPGPPPGLPGPHHHQL